jgi:hypothetical protein
MEHPQTHGDELPRATRERSKEVLACTYKKQLVRAAHVKHSLTSVEPDRLQGVVTQQRMYVTIPSLARLAAPSVANAAVPRLMPLELRSTRSPAGF